MRPATTEQLLRFFFRLDGRIGREEFVLGFGCILAANLAMLIFILEREDLAPATLLLLSAISLPMTVGIIVVMVKRCHDLGLPGSFFLLIFVPLVGLVWPFALATLPGNPAPNRYGPPPKFETE